MTPPVVKRYLVALNQHKLIGLASFLLITGISGVIAIQQESPPTIYDAEGVLSYTTPPTLFSETGGQIQEQGRQLTPGILLADNVVGTVAKAVQVEPDQIRENVDLDFPEAEKDDEAPPQIINVSYPDTNPQRAVETLDLLMQQMVEQSRLINTERLRTIIGSIEKRSAGAQEELRAAEQALERYDRIEGAELLAAQDGTLVSSITGSQEQQRQIQLTLGGVEAQLNSLVNKLGLTPEQAYTSSALSADPIIANLRAQILQTETQIEVFSRDLRPEHPTMIQLRQQQQAYEALLQERAAEVLGGGGVAAPLTGQIRQDSSLDPARQQLANTLVSLQTQRDTLKQQLEATRRSEQELLQAYRTLPTKQLERDRLAQQFQLQQTFYGKLQTALVDARAAEAETVSSLSVAQPPKVKVEETVATNPLTILGGGAVFGLIAAGGLIFLLSTLDNTLYTSSEVRDALAQRELPLLGELPFVVMLDPDGQESGILVKPDSPDLEFYERVRSNLRRVENQSVKVVLITSTVEQEGKTVCAYNLAIASAQAGKRTLLVEADLRSPTHAQTLKVVADPEARLEPLHYYSSQSSCVRLVPDLENLYIVPSPGPQRRAAAILESSELRRFLEDVRGRFDFVVLDTPALSRCNDALLLEPLTDGLVLVTRPGYTQGTLLAEALDELTEAELPLLGGVINGVDQPGRIAVVEEMEIEETVEPEDLKADNVVTARRF